MKDPRFTPIDDALEGIIPGDAGLPNEQTFCPHCHQPICTRETEHGDDENDIDPLGDLF